MNYKLKCEYNINFRLKSSEFVNNSQKIARIFVTVNI